MLTLDVPVKRVYTAGSEREGAKNEGMGRRRTNPKALSVDEQARIVSDFMMRAQLNPFLNGTEQVSGEEDIYYHDEERNVYGLRSDFTPQAHVKNVGVAPIIDFKNDNSLIAKTRRRELLVRQKLVIGQMYSEIIRQATTQLSLSYPEGLDAQKAGRMMSAIHHGLSVESAAAQVGILASRLKTWQKKANAGHVFFVLLFGLVELAESRLEEYAVDAWVNEIDGDWKAAQAFLAKRMKHKGWADKPQLELSGRDLSNLSDDELKMIVGDQFIDGQEIDDDAMSQGPETADDLLARLIAESPLISADADIAGYQADMGNADAGS